MDRIRCSCGRETAGLVPVTHKNLMDPSSQCRKISMAWVGGDQCGICAASTFHARAISDTWSSFCQFRKPVRVPFAPVSRVFCAVGCPFIWKTVQPGRPIMPRSRWRLLTWTAAAVAWCD